MRTYIQQLKCLIKQVNNILNFTPSLSFDEETNTLTSVYANGQSSGTIINIEGDNKPRVISYGIATTTGGGDPPDIAGNINSLPQFTVEGDEDLYFTGLSFPGDRSPVSYRETYVVRGKGKGVWGLGGNIVVSTPDLHRIETSQVSSFPSDVSNDEATALYDLGEIGDLPVHSVVNNTDPAIIIDDKNWFFEGTRDGSRVLYAYTGLPGTYGTFAGNTLEEDYFLVYDEEYAVIVTNTSDLQNDGEDGVNPFITAEDIPDVPEYTLSAINGSNQFQLLKDNAVVDTIDLTPYLDDTNLARIVSGVVDPVTGVATITRDDSSTFTIDFSSLIDTQPTNTSQLNNNGADGTSTYVEHDELGAAATSNNYNDLDNIPSPVTVPTNLSAFTDDIGATDILAEKTFFIKAGSDASIAQPNNKSKPFPDFSSAIASYFSVAPTNSTAPYYKFEVLDAETYIISEPMIQNRTGGAYPIVFVSSEFPCTINFQNNNTSRLVIMSNSPENLASSRVCRLDINIPYGKIELSGTGDVIIGDYATNSLKTPFGVINIKARDIIFGTGFKTLGGLGNISSLGVSRVEVENIYVNDRYIIYSAHPNTSFKTLKTYILNNSGNGDIVYKSDYDSFVLNLGDIDASAKFSIIEGGNGKITFEHGDLTGSYAGGFSYIRKAMFVKYKDNAVITLNAYIQNFNGVVVLIGTKVTYTNQTFLHLGLAYGELIENLGIEISVNFLELSGDLYAKSDNSRNGAGISLNNCYLKLGGILADGFHFNDRVISGRDEIVMLKINGTCVVDTSLAPDTKILYTKNALINMPPKPLAKINGTLSIINGKIDQSTIEVVKPEKVYQYNTNSNVDVPVDEKEEIINQVLDVNKIYKLEGDIELLAGEYIDVPASGNLTINGAGLEASIIRKNVAGESIFRSPVGGSGGMQIDSVKFIMDTPTTTCFDITDASGFNAVECVKVNFEGSGSIGTLNNYRQGLWTNIGVFGLSDGLTFEGTWVGGFVTNTVIVRNLSGTTGTLFKKGTSLTFNSRFTTDGNIDVPTGWGIADFEDANFTNENTFQVQGAIITRAGVIDDTDTLFFPNINEEDSSSSWKDNVGCKNSALNFEKIKSPNGTVYKIEVDNSGVLTTTPI